jgi:hypothetical protein
MKTIAKMMALCLLLGTLSFAQDAPKKGGDDKKDAPATTTEKKKSGKKGHHKGGKKADTKSTADKPADKK